MSLFVYIDLNFSFNFGHYFNIFSNLYSSAIESDYDFLLVNSEWTYYKEEKEKHGFQSYKKLHRILLKNNPENINQIVEKFDFKGYSNVKVYIYKGGIEFVKPLSHIHDYLLRENINFEIWNTLFLIPFDKLNLEKNVFHSDFESDIQQAQALLKSRKINLCFDNEKSVWDNYFSSVAHLPPPLLAENKIHVDHLHFKRDFVYLAIDVWDLSYSPKYRNETISLIKSAISNILNNNKTVKFKIKIANSNYKIDPIRDAFFLNNPRIEIYTFLSEDKYLDFIRSTDIYILQYAPTFYKNKSSGHFIELIQNNIFIIGTKNTFLEDNIDNSLFTYEFGNEESLINVCNMVLRSKSYLNKRHVSTKYKRLVSLWSKINFKSKVMTTNQSQKTKDVNSIKANKPFIVLGNGPSLKGFDFFKLSGYNTIGMNAAYRYWDRINWYPTYYICLDTVVVKSHHREINRLVQQSDKLGIKKFFIREHLFELQPQLKDHPKVITYEEMRNENKLVFDCVHVTTGSFAARLAINEGFKDILLLGIDENYVNFIKESKRKEDIKLEITETPKSNPNYFFDDYQQKGDLYQVANHDKIYTCRCRHCNGETRNGKNLHIDAWKFIEMDLKDKTFISEYGHINIINCNPESGVRFFPFESFDKAISNIESNEKDKVEIPLNNTTDTKNLISLPITSFYGDERLLESKNEFQTILNELDEFEINLEFRSLFNETSFETFGEYSPPMPLIVSFFTLFDFGTHFRLSIKNDDGLQNNIDFPNTYKSISLKIRFKRKESYLEILLDDKVLFNNHVKNVQPISEILILGSGFKSRYWKGEIYKLNLKSTASKNIVYNLDQTKLNESFKKTNKMSLNELFTKPNET